jgi:hypothetical protein
MKKYKLTNETKTLPRGTVLHRIEALIDWLWGPAGTKGGLVESEKNLSHGGECWVSGNAQMYCNAWASGVAKIESCHINDDYPKYTLIRYDNMLGIGCKHHTIDKWESLTPGDVAHYDSGASAWWDEHKESVIKWARSVT